MKKKKTSPAVHKPYTITENRNGLQVRLRPEWVAVKAGDLVKQFVFDPDVHVPRAGDLIVRKVTVID